MLGAVEVDARKALPGGRVDEGERLLPGYLDRRVDGRDLGVDADRVEDRRRYVRELRDDLRGRRGPARPV